MGLVSVGENIPLSILLEGESPSSKFVRAILTDASGAFLPASPKSMAYITGRLFQDYSIPMPDTGFVMAQYQIFDDAAFTIPTADFVNSTAGERFDKSFEPKLDQIIGKIAGVGTVDYLSTVIGGDASFVGVIASDELQGVVKEERVVATMDEDNLVGVPGVDTLTGTIRNC